MHAAPAVSCANAHKRNAHEHTGTGGAFRPSLRSGFTAYFVLFPANGSFASVAQKLLIELNASTAASNHTTSPYAQAATSVVAFASTASHRAFVTIASRPSYRVRRHME